MAEGSARGALIVSTTEVPVLLCRAGSRVCALPVAHVVEVLRPLAVERMSGVPAFVRGLSVVRGSPVPVLGLAELLGGDAGATADGRWVICRAGEHRMALSTASVLGIRSLRSASLTALPPLLRECASAAVDAIGALDADLLFVLGTARLVPDDVWRAVADR